MKLHKVNCKKGIKVWTKSSIKKYQPDNTHSTKIKIKRLI
jgi:hypothetical protein